MPKNPKVLIIFPRFSVDDSSHYNYWYQLFASALNQLDLVVIFESGTKATNLFGIQTHTQTITTKPLKLVQPASHTQIYQ